MASRDTSELYMCAPCTSFYAHCILLTIRGTDIALQLTHCPQTLVLRVKRKKLTVFVQVEPTDTVLEVKHKLHDMLSQVREDASPTNLLQLVDWGIASMLLRS